MGSLADYISMLNDESPSVRRDGVKYIESTTFEMHAVAEALTRTIRNDPSEWVVNAAISALGRIARGSSRKETAAFLADLVASESLTDERRRRAYLALKQIVGPPVLSSFKSLDEMNAAVSEVLFQVDTTTKFNPDTDVDWGVVRRYQTT